MTEMAALKTVPFAPPELKQKTLRAEEFSLVEDQWSDVTRLVLRYAAHQLATLAEQQEGVMSAALSAAGAVTGLWWEISGNYVDDLARLFATGEPAPEHFKKSYEVRRLVADTYQRVFLDQSGQSTVIEWHQPFDARKNFLSILESARGGFGAGDNETLAAAKRANRRLRGRHAEDTEKWAQDLASDLSKLSD